MNTGSNADGANHGRDNSGNKKGRGKKAAAFRGLVINTTRQFVDRAAYTPGLLTPASAIKNSPNDDQKAESDARWENEELQRKVEHLKAVLEFEGQEAEEAERKLREIRAQQNSGGSHGNMGGGGNASRR